MSQQARIAARKNRSLVGREAVVLVEGPSRESDLLLQGRLESQAPEIDGICLINDSEVGEVSPGEFCTLRVTRAVGHDLLGVVTGREGAGTEHGRGNTSRLDLVQVNLP
jgi:ribosomal protein S12 methylthiotransferase